MFRTDKAEDNGIVGLDVPRILSSLHKSLSELRNHHSLPALLALFATCIMRKIFIRSNIAGVSPHHKDGIMSAEAIAVWQWIGSMNMKSGDFVDFRAFNAWCANTHLSTAGNFIPAMDELVALGNLVDRNASGEEKTWDYWVA